MYIRTAGTWYSRTCGCGRPPSESKTRHTKHAREHCVLCVPRSLCMSGMCHLSFKFQTQRPPTSLFFVRVGGGTMNHERSTHVHHRLYMCRCGGCHLFEHDVQCTCRFSCTNIHVYVHEAATAPQIPRVTCTKCTAHAQWQ